MFPHPVSCLLTHMKTVCRRFQNTLLCLFWHKYIYNLKYCHVGTFKMWLMCCSPSLYFARYSCNISVLYVTYRHTAGSIHHARVTDVKHIQALSPSLSLSCTLQLSLSWTLIYSLALLASVHITDDKHATSKKRQRCQMTMSGNYVEGDMAR